MIYVILAHTSPEMLSIIVKKLQNKKNHFVIHIDRNQDITPFVKSISELSNCHFTPKRFSSYWGSFALVDATLHAFDFIRKELKKRQRIVLLSGADLPIKSNLHIERYLNSHPDTIFIEYEPIPRKLWHTGGLNRFPLYETVSESIKFYGGSQWFSIPYKALSIIFMFLKNSPDFITYFRHVKIPDESFFQTLFLNCENSYITNNLRNQNLHLIKWDYPYTHPRVLTEKNLYLVKKSKSLFARKFNVRNSSALINNLTENLLDFQIDNNKKTVVVYLTDNIDRYKGRYKKLKKQLKTADVFSIITNKLHYKQQNDSTLYEHHNCEQMGYTPFKEDAIIPYSTHLALLYFFKQNPQYDYYWLIQDDVVYNGHWSDFFNRFVANTTDFIGCYNTRYKDAKHWFWWNDIFIPNHTISPKFKIRTFNPVARFSAKALYFLDQILKSGASGHSEVLVPTMLSLNGFSISDIADEAQFDKSKPLIIPCTKKAIDNDNNGTFRYLPHIMKEEIQGEYLFHPVKFNTIE